MRFPAILKIGSQPPARFQEKIRAQFPLFSPSKNNQGLQFASEDKNWRLVLTQRNMALSVRKYDGWQSFKSHLEAPLAALVAEYAPQYFERMGLRYQNLVRRSVLGLNGEAWGKLLNSQATGSLVWPDFAGEITGTKSEVLMSLNGSHCQLRVNHGMVTLRGDGEGCYVIDNDVFVNGKTEVRDAQKKLEDLHREARRMFQWWVTEKLHKAMGPEG